MRIDGVRDLHMLRTRQMGPKSLVDVHILLDDPKLSVSEGHQISETARAELIRQFHDIEDVTVHIDPEDDEEIAHGRDLGLRGEIESGLRADWADVPEVESIRRITLHYLDGRIQVEVELPLDLALEPGAPESIRRRFEQAVRKGSDVSEVRVLFGLTHQSGSLTLGNASFRCARPSTPGMERWMSRSFAPPVWRRDRDMAHNCAARGG